MKGRRKSKSTWYKSTKGILPSLWRISKYTDLKGIGGEKTGGRWHSKGRLIVYLGRTPSGVLLEYIVHLLENRFMPLQATLIEALYPSSLQVEVVSESVLPSSWTTDLSVTRAVGDKWLRESRTPLLDTPRVIIPDTRNCLLNPNHPDARTITTHGRSFSMDTRLQRIVEYAFSYREEVLLVRRDS